MLNNTVKSDTHYQKSEKELIQILKKAYAFALNRDKPVENFLLYLRSQQVSPLIQFKKQKGKNKKALKRISGISFLFKGCSYKGSNLSKTLNKEKFNKPFSADSLFSESMNTKTQQKLMFSQDEIESLTLISQRNYDVKRAIDTLSIKDKENFIFSLHPDERVILSLINTTGSALTIKHKPSINRDKIPVMNTERVLDKVLLTPEEVTVKEDYIEDKKQKTGLTHDNFSLTSLPNKDFIIAEISLTLFDQFTTLELKTIEHRKTEHMKPNFLLFTSRQRYYYAFKPNLNETFQYLKEEGGLSYQSNFTDREIEKLVKAILALVKAFLEFIRQLFSIPDTRILDTVTVEKIDHVIDVKMQTTKEIQSLFDESEHIEIKKELNRLTPETIYVDSVNNKRALAAMFMSVIHKVPTHYWLKLYNDNTLEPLLRAIGEHAYSVCKHNALVINSKMDDKLLSKDMLFYLAQHFSMIYDPVFGCKITKLTKEGVIRAVNLVFENSDSGINYKLTPWNLSGNIEDNYPSR
ncbi:MAG: hypothetical protein QNK36_00885 [Colwellia sp.]|nr:hypothetical protein [Colwellia sp.]